jgi:hypothetical protein
MIHTRTLSPRHTHRDLGKGPSPEPPTGEYRLDTHTGTLEKVRRDTHTGTLEKVLRRSLPLVNITKTHTHGRYSLSSVDLIFVRSKRVSKTTRTTWEVLVSWLGRKACIRRSASSLSIRPRSSHVAVSSLRSDVEFLRRTLAMIER